MKQLITWKHNVSLALELQVPKVHNLGSYPSQLIPYFPHVLSHPQHSSCWSYLKVSTATLLSGQTGHHPPPHPTPPRRKPGGCWSLTLYSTFGVDGTEHLLFPSNYPLKLPQTFNKVCLSPEQAKNGLLTLNGPLIPLL